jgi:hypothetical protein
MDNSPTQVPNIPQSPVLTSRALFENYDQDLKQLIASLKGKLEGDVKQLKGGMSSLMSSMFVGING